jgi:DNA repair protein RecN (Recombination protein N)
MLTALRIQNFAIIDELEVRFSSGFNVLTGETGAGKSILVDALHLVLGGRASGEVIRTGADEATVEALFEGVELGDRLASLGLPSGGGELLVRRVVGRNGRSRVWVNGAMATVGILEQITHGLIDVSGQHEHVSLLQPELHLPLLDGFAGLGGEVARYRQAHEELSVRLREKAALATDDAERARRSDYLVFQLEEIDRVDPRPDEEAQLEVERKRLASAERLAAAAEQAERTLYSGEASVADLLGAALTKLAESATIDAAFEPWAATLRSAKVEVEEVAREMSAYSRGIEADPTRLSEIEERLESVKRLCRKHGGNVASVLSRRDAMRSELDGIERHGERLSELEAEIKVAGERALVLATAVSEKRRAAADRFAQAVEKELGRLAMGKTLFRVSLTRLEAQGDGAALVDGQRLDARGIDACELLLAPNPGEEPKPLARIASGGELSRVMLAIKRALARIDPVPTYLFDEVDSGIGGAVAESVGRLLKEVSLERQVVAITHLPQIASFADLHFSVEKQVRNERTTSRVVALDDDARTHEIARMLAGVEVTRAALKNAEEMLGSSRRRRR